MEKEKKNKEDIIINLKKGRALIDKMIEMKEDDEYCVDIMQQLLAVIGLLKSTHQKLMEDHLKTCFRSAFETDEEEKKEEMIEEILKVTRLYNK